MAVGDIWRAAILMRVSTTQVVNVLHYVTDVSVGPVTEEAQALANAIVEDTLATWEAMNHSGIVWDTVSVRGVTNPTIGFDLSASGQGTQTGILLPFQTTTQVLWYTGLIGRSFRGKTYLPPTTEEHQQNGVVDATQIGLIEAYLDELMHVNYTSTSGAFSFLLAVYSELLDQANVVQSYFVTPTLRTQRRRTPGFGS